MALPEGKINARRRRQMISETFGVGRQRRAPPPSLPVSQYMRRGEVGRRVAEEETTTLFFLRQKGDGDRHATLSSVPTSFISWQKKFLIAISLLPYSSSPTEYKKLICPLSFEDYNHNPSTPLLYKAVDYFMGRRGRGEQPSFRFRAFEWALVRLRQWLSRENVGSKRSP